MTPNEMVKESGLSCHWTVALWREMDRLGYVGFVRDDKKCACPGRDAQPFVTTWVAKLEFEVPRYLAIKYLCEYGAWVNLTLATDQTLAERVLWTACNDIKENGSWYGLIH